MGSSLASWTTHLRCLSSSPQLAPGSIGRDCKETAESDVLSDRRLAHLTFMRIKEISVTYAAEDMCTTRATSTGSTDSGNFVSPGSLHVVKVMGLEPGTEFTYRAGLGFGQGVK